MKLQIALTITALFASAPAICAPPARHTKVQPAKPSRTEGAAEKKTNASSPAQQFFRPSETRTSASVTVAGQPITYDAIAGTLIVHAKDWEDTDQAEADAASPSDKDKNAPKPE